MTAEGLERFRERMKWTKKQMAALIGCDRKTLDRYLTPGSQPPIPRYIALACSALAHGLPPME